MKKVTKYIAFDETEFDSEESCEQYECLMRQAYEGAILFDQDMCIIDPDPEDISSWSDAWYIYIIDNSRFADALDFLSAHSTFSRPDCGWANGDVLAWDNVDGKWFNLTLRLKCDYDILNDILTHVKSKIKETEDDGDTSVQ